MSFSGFSASLIIPVNEEILVETKKYYCPFLERGFCRHSSRCSFSHEIAASTKIPHDYCHFYLANQCLNGEDCKFRHSEPNVNLNDISCASKDETSKANFIRAGCEGGDFLDAQVDEYDRCSHEAQEISAYPTYCLDCDLCGRPCLDPYNLEQQRQHRDECLREHEREMELSFAIQRSKDKVCGICMDTVVEKQPTISSRFGILEKCNHIFCLDCIRKWRGTKQFETRTIRACPECRVNSDFVVPSKYWVEDQEDKEKLINEYKTALKSKPCKYFNEGKGSCPFAGSCFYKHAYPDGRLAKLETPKPRRRHHRRRSDAAFANYLFWSIFTSRENDDWSDELESLFFHHSHATTDNDGDNDDDEDDDDLYEGDGYDGQDDGDDDDDFDDYDDDDDDDASEDLVYQGEILGEPIAFRGFVNHHAEDNQNVHINDQDGDDEGEDDDNDDEVRYDDEENDNNGRNARDDCDEATEDENGNDDEYDSDYDYDSDIALHQEDIGI